MTDPHLQYPVYIRLSLLKNIADIKRLWLSQTLYQHILAREVDLLCL